VGAAVVVEGNEKTTCNKLFMEAVGEGQRCDSLMEALR
jgi:hypothetical protein